MEPDVEGFACSIMVGTRNMARVYSFKRWDLGLGLWGAVHLTLRASSGAGIDVLDSKRTRIARISAAIWFKAARMSSSRLAGKRIG